MSGFWPSGVARNSATRWKNAGAQRAPIGIRVQKYWPTGVLKAVDRREARASGIDQKAERASMHVNHCMPAHRRKHSSIRGSSHTSSPFSAVIWFSLRKSTAKRKVPSFFRAKTTPLAKGEWQASMTSARSILSICLVISAVSSAVKRRMP